MLEVKHLKKTYKQVKAVDDISFKVAKGDVLGLLGPNGAGKSTTISMISTLQKADEGLILFEGKDILTNNKVISPYLGYVPQEIALYPNLSGMDNLQFFGRIYGLSGKLLKERIKQVADIIGIRDRLKDKVKTYSGGMKRRLNIGVALLHEPKLIIMDEPTVGIDPQSRNHILDTVLKLNEEGMTVIYTSHYMEEVELLCNRICIMDQGKIIAEGTKEALISQVDDYHELYIKLDHYPQGLIHQVSNLPIIRSVNLTEDGLKVQTEKDPFIFKKLIEALGSDQANVLSMDVKEPNLEKVFLKLTGRALRD